MNADSEPKHKKVVEYTADTIDQSLTLESVRKFDTDSDAIDAGFVLDSWNERALDGPDGYGMTRLQRLQAERGYDEMAAVLIERLGSYNVYGKRLEPAPKLGKFATLLARFKSDEQ